MSQFDGRRYTFRKPAGLTPAMEGYFYTGPSEARGHTTKPKSSSGAQAGGKGGGYGHTMRTQERFDPCAECNGFGSLLVGTGENRLKCSSCRGAGWLPRIVEKEESESLRAVADFYSAYVRECRGEECNTVLIRPRGHYCQSCIKEAEARQEKREKKKAPKRPALVVIERQGQEVIVATTGNGQGQ